MDPLPILSWTGLSDSGLPGRRFKCGFCGLDVSGDKGVRPKQGSNIDLEIRLCPHCVRPTYFEGDQQYPGSTAVRSVDHLPKDIGDLYEEARKAVAGNAHSAGVLACRKILMHVAVERGAESGRSFVDYVEYLGQEGFIPPNADGWVDYIRAKGNQANHEIVIYSPAEGNRILGFVEALLRIVYELPGRLTDDSGEETPEVPTD